MPSDASAVTEQWAILIEASWRHGAEFLVAGIGFQAALFGVRHHPPQFRRDATLQTTRPDATALPTTATLKRR
jgi:hypothetical protein